MNFDDIRPYHDEEVKEKINKLLSEPQFIQVVQKALPELPKDELQQHMRQISTVEEFQRQLVVPSLDKLIAKSTKGISFSGIENLEEGKNYLFVSTHRDIVLDSALMNYVLMNEGLNTAEIAIGDNLMKIPWIVDLVKLNKTFIVKRSLPKEQKVEGSMQLSAYINHTIKEKKESIWIAHRSGRSKDGNDRTNQSILKMFNLSANTDSPIENLLDLNIHPVAISYEYNPCDALTLPELMANARGDVYKKEPMEDIVHMGTGIEGEKGKVAIHFGKPLKKLLEGHEIPLNRNKMFALIAELIDKEIHANYHLMPTNYIAHDVLSGKGEFKTYYTEEEYKTFISYMQEKITAVEGDMQVKKDTFLKMYAYPVSNRMEALKTS